MSAKGRKRADAPATVVAMAPPLSSFHSVTGPGWTMYRGDCLEVLAAMPDKSVHVTLTDPPYEAEAHTEGRRQNGKTTDGGYREVRNSALPFAPIASVDRVAVAAMVARVTSHRALAFCQAEAIKDWKDAFNAAGMPYRRAIPWTKPDAMPSLHGRYPGQAFEAVALAGDDPFEPIVLAQFPSAPPCPMGGAARHYSFTRARPGQAGGPGGTEAFHPTTKPLPLMLAMVTDFTRTDDIVLDPFAGSGTTGVACIRLGRQFIGVEKDPDYFAIACRRLAGDEARPRKEQPSLFDALGGTP